MVKLRSVAAAIRVQFPSGTPSCTNRGKSLVVYGSEDEYVWGGVDRVVKILKGYRPELTYRVIKGGNHSFGGRQKELAEIVVDFLISRHRRGTL